MKTKTKSKIASVGAIAAAVALSFSIGATTMTSFADTANSAKKFSSMYDSLSDVLRDGEKLNEELAGEGFVLLKNKNAALPLAANERNVTLIGAETYNTVTGGGGSGTTNRPGGNNVSWVSASADNLVSSLNENGFNINPRTAARHGNGAGANGDRNTYMNLLASDSTEAGVVSFGGRKYDVAPNGFLAGADDNFKRYGDAAIISISRAGSEGTDNPSHHVAGHADVNEHYLTLNDSERQLLAYAKYHKEVVGDINKIIIIINSPAVMELGDIEDDDAFDSMLWVGVTGWNGASVIGKILNGEINPSGRTVDFWARDFSTDPSWYGFGDGSQALYALTDGDRYQTNDTDHGENFGATFDFGRPGTGAKAPSIDMDASISTELDNEANMTSYSEGIFTGYRYYETVAADLGEAGEAWYAANTLYPFGYGLSYTTFSQEIVEVEGNLASASGKITVKVEVKNVGNTPGKEVVQLYSTPEYKAGEIDKAEVNLVGFAKSDMLRPGKSQVVDVTIDVKDLASFDYNDANANNFNGYEVEEGDYVLSVRKNSHEVLDSETLNAASLLTWDEDGNPATPNNIYSQESGAWEIFNTSASHWTTSAIDHDLHRNGLLNAAGNAPSDLTSLAWYFGEDNAFSEKAFSVLTLRDKNTIASDFDNHTTVEVETDYQNLWVKTAADMRGKTQGKGTVGDNGMYETILSDMAGISYDDEKWDTFLDQLTYAELQTLIANGSYRTTALATIGKRQVADQDGPAQMAQGWSWVCEPVIASTYNVDLAYRQGEIVGNETMWVNGGTNGGIGWYGPAMNTHRSPLSGRNFEYYSQDGMQAGLMGAAVVKGVVDQGGRVYIKHSFLNDQETSRVGVCSLVNEQALRQIYAKPFELAIKKGNANGIMLSFNAVGLSSSAGYATAIQLYTNEWGYKGVNVTDYWMAGTGAASPGWDGFLMPRGTTIPLGNVGGTSNVNFQLPSTWDADANNAVITRGSVESYTHWYWVRETAKRVAYVHANTNANANGYVPNMLGGGRSPLSAGAVAVTGNAYAPITPVSLINTAQLDEVFGNYGYTLAVSSGTLPAGVTLNASTGVISGTPTESVSNRVVTVSLTGNGGLAWMRGMSCRVTFNIGAAIPIPVTSFGVGMVDGDNVMSILSTDATVNTAYAGASARFVGLVSEGAGQNHWPTGTASEATYNDGNGYIGNIAYSAIGLPAGLSIDASTGAVSGTPTEFGDFAVTVRASIRQVTRTSSWGGFRYSTTNRIYTATLNISISGGFFITVMDGDNAILRVPVLDGGSTTVGDILSSDAYRDLVGPAVGMTAAGLKAAADAENVLGNDTSFSEATTLHINWSYPPVTIVDGIWWINGVNTGIRAEGIQGETGANGADGSNGIDGADGIDGIDAAVIISIDKVATVENVDTYRILLSDGSTFDFTLTNGIDGAAGENGAAGADGANGANGLNGADANAGLTIGLSVAALVIGAAAAGLGVWLFIKKRKQ